MRYSRFFKGIELWHPRLTRSPRIWFGYLCWWYQNNVHVQAPPPWWRLAPGRLMKRWMGGPFSKTPWGRTCNWWDRMKIRLTSWSRRYTEGFGGCRSDWTDKEHGHLYGGTGWSDEAFSAFVGDISADPAAGQLAVEELRGRMRGSYSDSVN